MHVKHVSAGHARQKITKLSYLFAASAAAAFAAQTALGVSANFTWTGTGTPNNVWDTTAANWSGGGSTWVNSSTATTPNNAVFNIAGTTVTVNSAIVPGTITFTTGGWNLANGTGSLSIGALYGPVNIVTTTGTDTINAKIVDTAGLPIGSASLSTGIAKTGAGTLVLGGANTFTGPITVTGGPLNLDFGQAGAPTNNIVNNVTNSSSLTLTGSTLNVLGSAGSANSQQLNGLSFGAGQSTVVLTSNGQNLFLSLGALTRSVNSTVDFTLPTGTQSGTNGITTTTAGSNGILVSAGGTAFATNGPTTWAGNTGGQIVSFNSYSTNYASAASNIDVGVSDAPGSAFTVNTLRFNANGASVALTGANTISTGGILITNNVTGAVSITGGTSLSPGAGGELVIINNGVGDTVTLGTAIVGATNGVTITGSGTIVLGASNTVGSLRMVGGTLDLGGNSQSVAGFTLGSANITSTASGTAVLTTSAGGSTSGIVSDTDSSHALALTAMGAVSLTNTASGFHGAAIIRNGGSLAFSSGSTASMTRAGDVTLDGATFSINANGAANATTDTAGILTPTSGNSAVTVTASAGFSSTLTFNSLAARATGSVVTYTGTKIGQAAGANVAQIKFASTPTLVGGTAGTATAPILPYTVVTDSVAGTSFLATYDATTGVRALVDGTETFIGDNPTTGVNWSVGSGGGQTAGTVAVNSISANGAGAVIFNNGTTTVTSGTVLFQGAGDSIQSGTLDFGANEGMINTLGAATTVTATSAITGSAGVIKAGTGLLTLSSVSNNFGALTIYGGAVAITNELQLGPVPGSITPRSIVLNGGHLVLNGSLTLSSTRGIALGSADNAGGTGNIDQANANKSMINGVISDNGTGPSNLVFGVATNGLTSNGTLVLTGTNTYSGFTNLLAGHLSITSAAALGVGTGPASIRINGAALDAFSGTVDIPVSKGIQIGAPGLGVGNGQLNAELNAILQVDSVISEAAPGQILQIGTINVTSGTTILNGLNTFTGQMRAGIGSGNCVVIFTFESASGGSPLGLVPTSLSPRALSINGQLVYDGTISGTATIGVNRGVVLGSNNTAATGGNTIDAFPNSILVINSVIAKNGTLPTGSGIDSLIKGARTGTVVLGAANTYDGNTTINGGTLSISSDGNLGTGFDTVLAISASTLQITSSMTLGSQRVMKMFGNATLDIGANNVSYAGSMINNSPTTTGNLIKLGSGTLTIGAPSNFSGTATISAGKVAFTGSGSISSAVATVSGTGILNATPQGGFFSRSAGGATTAGVGGTYDLVGQSIADAIVLSGGKLTNSGVASTLSTGTVKGVGYTLTTTTSAFSGNTTVGFSGGGGSGATAVAELGLTNATFTNTNVGSGYTSTPTVTFTGGLGAGGVAATAIVSMSALGPSGLTAASLTIINPGYGYTSAPTVVLTGGGGSGATWSTNNNNFYLVGISTTNAGSGYTSAPVAAFAGTTIPASTLATPLMSSFALTGTASTIGGTGNITINSPITGVGGGFTKVDGNALVLNGVSTYDQATNVNGGTIGGSGTLASTLVGGATAHTIAPSATLPNSTATTMTVGGLTTSSSTTMLFNLVSAGVNDKINVTGNLNVSAGGGISVNDASVPQGYYKVLQYSSLTGNPVTTLSVLTPPPNSKEAYIIDTHHDAGFVDIHKALIGDVDGSGLVDGADFDIWFTHLQVSTFSYEQGDLNGDGLVDGADFDIWFTHLQNSFGGFTQTELNELSGFLSPSQLAGLGAAVPEPTSLALLGLGAMGLLGRRRRR